LTAYSAAANEKLEEANVDIYTRPDVYQALCDLEARGLPMEPLQKRLLDKMKIEFERNGYAHFLRLDLILIWIPHFRMHLRGEAKERFIVIKKRISELCIKFQTNLNEDKTEVLFTTGAPSAILFFFVSGLLIVVVFRFVRGYRGT
jgi:Zn-dependent oligopeptidase